MTLSPTRISPPGSRSAATLALALLCVCAHMLAQPVAGGEGLLSSPRRQQAPRHEADVQTTRRLRIGVATAPYARTNVSETAGGLHMYHIHAHTHMNGYAAIAPVDLEHPCRPGAVDGLRALEEALGVHDWILWQRSTVVVSNPRSRVEDLVNQLPASTHVGMVRKGKERNSLRAPRAVLLRGSVWSQRLLTRILGDCQRRRDQVMIDTNPLVEIVVAELQKSTGRAQIIMDETHDGLFDDVCEQASGEARGGACTAQLQADAILAAILRLPTPYAPVIVSGASSNHAAPALCFLDSVYEHHPEQRVVFWDLGLTPRQRWLIGGHPSVSEFHAFNYSAYPAYFDINVAAGEYAWKPVIVEEVMQSHRMVFWLDAGSIITASIAHIWSAIGRRGTFSPSSPLTLAHFVHPGMLSYYRHLQPYLRRHDSMCSGGVAGFLRDSAAYHAVLLPWAACAREKQCIAPTGSHRGNHRQDQAALTVLLNAFGFKCTDTWHVILHQDDKANRPEVYENEL